MCGFTTGHALLSIALTLTSLFNYSSFFFPSLSLFLAFFIFFSLCLTYSIPLSCTNRHTQRHRHMHGFPAVDITNLIDIQPHCLTAVNPRLLFPTDTYCDFESPCSWSMSNLSGSSDWQVTSPQRSQLGTHDSQPATDHSVGSADGEAETLPKHLLMSKGAVVLVFTDGLIYFT